ncbi:MAG: alanyl-tRNA editing protein [Oscillospiraceae bacterium]|nr:alanyl-tRNA editing protein [Oscillospiraceae bacterium]
MTRKLYYEDCHLREFTARVVSCEEGQAGWEVVLDRTAFYPEGGGQACDIGSLGGVKVLDTRERGEEIVHLCDKPLEVGEEITGKIDWQRRFDLMQQHTGEHIVSGIIHRRFGYANVGFHVGADTVTIDFDGPIPADAVAEIEKEANEFLWRNVPVKCWVPSPEELPGVVYRTKRALPWPVRIVEIPGADSCACCGVHVGYTGEVGLLKLFSCVKFHQGVRMEMACGGRALALLNAAFEQNRQVSQAFSAKIWETGEAARRMNEALGKEKARANALEKEVFAGIAERYVNQEAAVYVACDLTAGQVRALAEAIAQKAALAAVYSQGSLCLLGDADKVKQLALKLKAMGARGGGKPGSWQGSAELTEDALKALVFAQ